MIFQHHSEVIFKNKKHAAVMKNCSTTSLLCVGKTQGYSPIMVHTGRLGPKFRRQVYERVGITSGGSRGARGARVPPLFLDQAEARKAEKKFFGDRPPAPPPLFQGLDPALITVVEAFEKEKKICHFGPKRLTGACEKVEKQLTTFLIKTSTQKMGIRTWGNITENKSG